MIRTLIASLAVLTLAACGADQTKTAAGGGMGSTAQDSGGPRAPDHPSQSRPPQTETRQLTITDENRAMVEANIRSMLDQLTAASGASASPGTQDVLAAIQPAADHQFPVNLTAGTAYTIVGVCDADCNDVDLELLNGQTGEVVASDLLTDDVPVVRYTPAADAAYFVRIILKTCEQAPCYVGARVLQ